MLVKAGVYLNIDNRKSADKRRDACISNKEKYCHICGRKLEHPTTVGWVLNDYSWLSCDKNDSGAIKAFFGKECTKYLTTNRK